MPTYVFEHPQTGQTVERIRPVADRDQPLVIEGETYRRRTAPSAVTVLGHTAHPVLGRNLADEVLGGYRAMELEHGDKTGCEFSPKEIKKIWTEPLPPSRNSS